MVEKKIANASSCSTVNLSEKPVTAQLGSGFHDWLKLTPSKVKPDGAELMYIVPSEPLEL